MTTDTTIYVKPSNNSRSSDKCPVNFGFWPAKAYPGRTLWPCMSVAQISGKYGKILFIIQFTILRKKCSVVFHFHSLLHLHQGCCLMGARRIMKVLFKKPEQAPKHGVSILHSHLNICPMTSIFWWNWSKNHSHNKLNENQQLLWFCFAFIMRNMDQNMATKSLSLTKQPKTPIFENRPIMHCKLSIE